jgi:hypothetical protein
MIKRRPELSQQGVKERKEYANKLWEKLVSTTNYKKMWIVFYPVLEEFDNGLRCFEYGSDLAAVLTCRVVIEGALYIATANENLKSRTIGQLVIQEYVGSWNAMKCSRFLMEMTLEGLKKEALEQKIIDKVVERKINKIQKKGNIAAHYIQKFSQHQQRWIPRTAEEIGIDKALKKAGAKYYFNTAETIRILNESATVIANIMEGMEKTKLVKQ